MKALLQRVKQAAVSVEDKTVGKIKKGLLIFLCIEKEDTKIKSKEKSSKTFHELDREKLDKKFKKKSKKN